MGSTSKVCAVILRVWELVCSAVVLGIVARFVDRINDAGVGNDSRLIYTLVLASISTLYSILFMPPFLYNFLAFAADFILFIMWMVAFGLLANVSIHHRPCRVRMERTNPGRSQRSATNTCNSYWYWNYWGYYWGGWYYNPIVVNGPADIAYSGCSQWRAVLAFSFMASITFLLSAILVSFLPPFFIHSVIRIHV